MRKPRGVIMTEKTVAKDLQHTDTEIQHTFIITLGWKKGRVGTAASKKHRN